ncbi:hypothetical protein OFO10_05990 [Campylobacter sp. VBCF_06 NA8]|uniref:hypothetical protein n=1 Tax=Campylobacter sp. VBCF_06 NA8 TaxID=2983822 RepID=UPI0022E9CE83|nr:hypothetical protein [Campylobacter sp. VBCF_06 NA8]MDA3046705.1 hypothetical protein [Campylobacter sp. VBCF_06 NA8]
MLIYIPENLRNSGGGNATPYDDRALKARLEALEARTDSDTIYNDSELRAEIAELKERVAVLEKFHAVAPSDDDTRALYGIKAVGFSYFDTGFTLDTASIGYIGIGYIDGENPGALIGAYKSNALRDIVEFMGKSRKIQVKIPNNKEYSAGTIDLNAPMCLSKRTGDERVYISNLGGEIFNFETGLKVISDSETTYQVLPLLGSGAPNQAVYMSGVIKQNGNVFGLYPVKIKGEICLLKVDNEAVRDDILADIKANGFDAEKHGDKILRGAGEATFAEVVAPE